jgi:hypothetical protein
VRLPWNGDVSPRAFIGRQHQTFGGIGHARQRPDARRRRIRLALGKLRASNVVSPGSAGFTKNEHRGSGSDHWGLLNSSDRMRERPDLGRCSVC